jgi:hypothetical protein
MACETEDPNVLRTEKSTMLASHYAILLDDAARLGSAGRTIQVADAFSPRQDPSEATGFALRSIMVNSWEKKTYDARCHRASPG